MTTRTRPSAFTLVELLVCIGIIAGLIALLIPSLKMARQASRTAQCLSNMRTVADAAANYEAQYHGGLKLDMVALLPDHSGSVGSSNLLDSRFTFCPALVDYLPDSTLKSPTFGISISYNWNSWLVALNSILSPGLFHPSSVRNCSEVALMADTLSLNATGMSLNSGPGLQDPVWSGALYQPAQPPAVPSLCAPTFHGRHGGNGVVLWLDGHASQQPAVRVPTGMTVSHAYGGLQQSPQNYNKLHIGYLARSANDLNSIAAIYYFVSNKNALSQNNINAYLSLQLSAGRMVYAVNPAAY